MLQNRDLRALNAFVADSYFRTDFPRGRHEDRVPHASKFGNKAWVADEFKKQMGSEGVTVNVHHIREASPQDLPSADLYLFSEPGRMGKPIGGMRRFLKKVRLPAATKHAILTTEAAPKPDKKTGRMPTEEEMARWQRVIPIMNEIPVSSRRNRTARLVHTIVHIVSGNS
ncbi:MAG: hypothetical protein ACXWDJ_06990 [Aeromicrobium sp.]